MFELLLEAQSALSKSGCPTASAIAFCEALMRALCDRALYFLSDANCRVKLEGLLSESPATIASWMWPSET